MSKRRGQRAYERELQARPTYDDGSPRKSWEELTSLDRWTWERNPTPRWQLQENDDAD